MPLYIRILDRLGMVLTGLLMACASLFAAILFMLACAVTLFVGIPYIALRGEEALVTVAELLESVASELFL